MKARHRRCVGRRYGKLLCFDIYFDISITPNCHKVTPWGYFICDCREHYWIPWYDIKFKHIDRCKVCLERIGIYESTYYYGPFRTRSRVEEFFIGPDGY